MLFSMYLLLATLQLLLIFVFFFFFNVTATTEIYTLSLHDALPICRSSATPPASSGCRRCSTSTDRSEEHTSELQSPCNLVCRLLLEKKKTFLLQLFRGFEFAHMPSYGRLMITL